MTPGLRFALTLALLVLALWFYDAVRPVPQPPGILAPDAPVIDKAPEAAAAIERDGVRLTPLARFSAHGRVLSLENYGSDRAGTLAPIDVALGWGPLSDSNTLKVVDIAQSRREVLFQSYDPELPDEQVADYLVNLHVVPGDAEVKSRLADLRRGNLVRMEGLLVEATAEDGFRWKGEPRKKPPAMPGQLLYLQKLEVLDVPKK